MNLQKRQSTSFPPNSPHHHGKLGPKRRRTMKPSPAKVYILQGTHGRTRTLASHYPNLQLAQFIELECETASKIKLSNEAFAHFLQKCALPNFDSGEVLKPLREFLLPTAAQLTENDPSRIYYTEILGENADSEETMTHVVEELLDKFSAAQQKWVVLVGDGKTYDHLQNVKGFTGLPLRNYSYFQVIGMS